MRQPACFRTRSERLVVKDAGGEVVVYDLDTDRVHLLNAVASSVWRLAKEDVNFVDLSDRVRSEPGLEDTHHDVVLAAVYELQSAGLLVFSSDDAKLVSRRTLLKAAGVAALAAPALTTILAPTPAAAASPGPCTMTGATGCNDPLHPCCETGVACTNNRCCNPEAANCTAANQCCSGECAAGRCAPCQPTGNACTQNFNCCNGTCTAGVCT